MSQRKRKIGRLEPFPSRRVSIRLIDTVALVAGTIGPIMTIPQIVEIYIFHQAAGVSLITWGTYALFDIPWVVYGIAHRERPIVITYTLWCTMNALVAIGVVVFGGSAF